MTDITPNARLLNRQRVAVQSMMPSGLQGLQADEIKDFMYDNLLARLSAFVLTEQLVDETRAARLDVPSSVWQHFKRDYMPQWFVRKFPVKLTTLYSTVHFTSMGTYPEASIPMPEDKFGRCVLFENISQVSPWEREQ